MELDQYQVILVNLDPTVGSEIKKTRPCVILSPIELNNNLRTLVIAPMTTTIRKYPSRVPVKHNKKSGMIALDQIRTIDKSRVVKEFKRLSAVEIANCKEVLKEIFVY